MKRIFFILLLLLIPTATVQAEEGGIFHGVAIKSNTGVPITWATDGLKNLNNVRHSPIPVYEFTEPTDLNKMYISGNACVRFFSDLGQTQMIKQINDIAIGNIQDSWNDINVKNVRVITASTCGNAMNIYLAELDFKPFVPIEYLPITNIKHTPTNNSVKFTWINPTGEEFRKVIIKRDGIEIASVMGNSYNDINLKSETSYTYEFLTQYSDGKNSISQTVNVHTSVEPPPPEPPQEITELTAIPSHNRVDLSWKLPSNVNFHHVNIYRDTVEKTAFINTLIGAERAYAASKEIFETNGTYFNDLTVSQATTYEYTLTTTTLENKESEGVTKQVTTLSVKPSIGGGGYEVDEETGDYTYYWSTPTKGQVKIMVGGVLYKTVQASDLKIVIPAKNMKFTILGAPDVKLIPIDEDGTEGVPTSPPSSGGIGGGDIPFTPTDLLGTGMGLMWLVGPLVLLALAFLLVPKLRNMILGAFNQKRGQAKTTERRFNS